MLQSAPSSNPSPKLVVGASVTFCVALIGSSLVTLALGPLPPVRGELPDLRAFVEADTAEPICQNIFDDSGSLCVSQPPPPPEPPEDSEQLPWCESAPRLVGVVHDDDPTQSYALFDQIGPKTTGEEVQGATVIAIHGEEVWLVTTSERCRLGLFDPDTGEPVVAAPTLRVPAVRVPEVAPTPSAGIRVSSGIHTAGETTYVDDSLLRDIVSDPRQLQGARLVPTERGFRLFGVRRGSLLEQVGVQNGDVIQRVGDMAIQTYDDLLAAYARYQDAPDLEILVERRGGRQRLRFARR